MGVYIKQLRKPDRCSVCKCNGGWVNVFCRITGAELSETAWTMKPPDWCPMEEITDEEITAGRNLLAAFEDDGK